MKLHHLGFVVTGMFAVALVGCPAPSEKEDVDTVDSGTQQSAAGSSGSGGKSGSGGAGSSGKAGGGSGGGGTGGGGSSGTGGGGSGGGGSGGGGSGGGGAAGSGMDAGAKDTAPPADTAAAAGATWAEVFDILKVNCTTGTCHGGEFKMIGTAKTRLEAMADRGCAGKNMPRAKLLAEVTNPKGGGCVVMPGGANGCKGDEKAPCLTAAQHKTISDWVAGGSKF